ncbi:MAG TPA: alpha/beta hydrolase [Actinophytocola sp.]|uniref:alpha/beta fold hydrolase n=1 Tax=Actinophytocola sp. TaxID=1872138 RepID=UPI002DDDB12B|nr:alpha/beta hydrolase [Actinophytocola sp.]HEV2778765.1 alpha/beta hydrolase [Actinophytocola sp.]
MGNEKIVRVNGVDLCMETFGDPADPAILLLNGNAASMDYWRAEFCQRLAADARFVIRYDSRDTGRSVSYPPGAPPYTSRDLVDDAIGLLDTLGLARAHLVGVSSGGGLGQVLAAEHPDRVASLTLISTTFAGSHATADLPPMSDRMKAVFAAEPAPPDWSDRAAVIEHLLTNLRPYAGSVRDDEAELRELMARIVDRTVDIESSQTNHWVLDDSAVEPVNPRPSEITAPTLVIHGTEDPLFPHPHGEALAREIPGAQLLTLDGVGHDYPPRPTWDVVITALVAHTS